MILPRSRSCSPGITTKMRCKKYYLFRQMHLRQGHAKKSFLSIRKNVSNVSSHAADIYDKRFLQEISKHDEILIVVSLSFDGVRYRNSFHLPGTTPPLFRYRELRGAQWDNGRAFGNCNIPETLVKTSLSSFIWESLWYELRYYSKSATDGSNVPSKKRDLCPHNRL